MRPSFLRDTIAWIGLALVALLTSSGDAQVIESVEGRVIVSPGGRPVPNQSPGNPQGPNNGQPGQKPDGENKEGEASGEEADGEKKEEEGKDDSDSVKRPSKPPRVPDPREFDVLPDESNRLRFAFHGQPWPELLQWLASISGYSLDWQQLPNDYVNITANRQYTVEETRDLFNRLLFDRGYTMVQQGQVLLVVKIDKLDPSLLPRVEDESQLLDLPAHDFVKITFQLPTALKADKAAEDIKPLLSSHAKVQPLMATNRLLVVDIVANLREVSRLINAEHAAATGNTVPREFPIRYARAEEVADQVMILLGLDSKLTTYSAGIAGRAATLAAVSADAAAGQSDRQIYAPNEQPGGLPGRQLPQQQYSGECAA